MGPRGARDQGKVEFFDFFKFEIWRFESIFLRTADNIEMPGEFVENFFLTSYISFHPKTI